MTNEERDRDEHIHFVLAALCWEYEKTPWWRIFRSSALAESIRQVNRLFRNKVQENAQ